jgi:hypothetical protein
MKGWIFGARQREDLFEVDAGEDPEWGPIAYEIVNVTYSGERFACSECALVLDGHEELAIANLPAEFEQQEEHEPDYEPDYGND